jgi:hypothetical protein
VVAAGHHPVGDGIDDAVQRRLRGRDQRAHPVSSLSGLVEGGAGCTTIRLYVPARQCLA